MITALDLQVFDPQKAIVGLLSQNESALERIATRAVGGPVDVDVRRQTLPAILRHTAARDAQARSFCVANLTTKRGATGRFDSLLSALQERIVNSLLVVTTSEVFNEPGFQALVLEHRDPERLGVMIEKPRELSKSELLEWVGKLIGSALTEVGATSPETSDRVHPPYLRASRVIRNPKTGRLDAKRIAEFFDLTQRDLAAVAQVTPQAISSTPDSKNIQNRLYPFEEIVRARLLFGEDDAVFRQWLNTPSSDLPRHEDRNLAPIDMIQRGHPEVVATLVENMMTGHPS